jgi:glycosyltransferase involved in cell wall biosynthesis
MNILLVSPHFPPRHIGGVETYTKRLAEYLNASGDHVEVVCVEQVDAPDAAFQVATDTSFGYPVHRLYTNWSNERDTFRASYHSQLIQRWTEDLIARCSPDVMHLHSGYLLGGAVLDAAHRLSVPTVVTLHDFWFICARITLLQPSGALCSGPDSSAKCAWCLATEQRRFRLPETWTGGRLGRAAVRLLNLPAAATALGWSGAVAAVAERSRTLLAALAKADLVMAPSRFLRDLMVRAGVPVDHITISRCGIEMPEIALREPRTRLPIRVGYLGQLAPHKGVGVLIDALHDLPGCPFEAQLYGDPQPHARYVDGLRQKAHLDSRIVFKGPYLHGQVYEILGRLDVIVVPSVWYENSPFVIQEAQAAHVPVIASRLGGMRELVQDEIDGLLFEPGNSRDLARQLRRMLEEPGLIERLCPDRTTVRTAENEMQELVAHYRRLSGRKSSSSQGFESQADKGPP